MQVNPAEQGLEKSISLEWIITNGLGGYASSTVAGLNTRKYHGLLVCSMENLERSVCLQLLEDEINTTNGLMRLNPMEFGGGFLRAEGVGFLKEFTIGKDHVVFTYESPDFRLTKKIRLQQMRNSVSAEYTLENRSSNNITHVVAPHVNFRGMHELTREHQIQGVEIEGDRVVIRCSDNTMKLTVSEGVFNQSGIWMKNINYRLEAERGYPSLEDSFVPAKVRFDVGAKKTRSYAVTATAEGGKCVGDSAPSVEKTFSDAFESVTSSADSFIVDVGGEKTVIAGYHWFGEWGRDAMISLPGLTLARGKTGDARDVIEHFLRKVKSGRIMTESESGAPVYRDFDATLWLVDRLYQYMKYAGVKNGGGLLKSSWQSIVGVMSYYSSLEKDGLIMHDSGTWMDTLQRSNAVEVQALWYNALNCFKKMSEVSDLGVGGVDVEGLISRFESSFAKNYFNGAFLRDCLGDDSFRPNQLIALSLDFPCVTDEQAKKVLACVEERLLSPYGLRTLDPKDGRYRGKYAGGVAEREQSYHNGTVWPWLLGPYVKAKMRYGAKREDMKTLLDEFFKKSAYVGALGCINEVFDGDVPHAPRGCVSQAWSVAEPLRAYFEDVLDRRPPHVGEFT